MKIKTLQVAALTALFLVMSMSVCTAASRIATVSGNWNNTATWNGAAVPTSADAVTINSGITVTVNIANAQCASLTFASVNISSALSVSGTNSLAITGLLSMPQPVSAGKTCSVNVYAGTLSCGSLTMSATTSGQNDIITITTGTLTVSGTLTTGTASCQIVFAGAGTLNMAGALIGSPTLTTVTGSAVNYTGSEAQTIYAIPYNGDLGLSGTGTKTMNAAITVFGTLNLSNGLLVNNAWLTMANGSTISRSGGRLIAAPTYAGTVNLLYSGASPISTGMELPVSSAVLNNLTANAGGVIQSATTETISTLYTQGFNGAPADWATEIVTDPSYTAPAIAYVATGTYPTVSPSEGSQCVQFNSWYCQTGAQVRLKKNTSAVSTAGKTNITMVFDWYVDPGYSSSNDYVTVQWSTNGTTWNNANSYSRYNAAVGWVTNSCVLPAGAENQATLYIAFLFTSAFGNNCSLDNLKLNASTTVITPANCTVNGILDLTTGTYTIGANSLALNGTVSGNSAVIGGATSNLSIGGSGSSLSLPAITNGLNNFSINRSNGVTLNGNLTVNSTLTLSNGILVNAAYLTMATGSAISRSQGSLWSAPAFAGTVNLVYTGSSLITTGYEIPVSAGVLNNLTTNAGGVVQGGVQVAPATILTDVFDDLTSWTGDIGTSNNQFTSSASASTGGMANECMYTYGSSSAVNYTNTIYRSVNTTGYTSLNISWKQFIENFDASTYPYTIKVQCAASASGPWADIYSISPLNSTSIGPETKAFNNWTTNVGGTFFIRYYITGLTYGINYWYFDDLVINAQAPLGPSLVTINGTLDLSSGTYSIASNTLALNGGIAGGNIITGSTTSNLKVGGSGSNLALTTITNGLNNFSVNRSTGVTLNGNLTVNGILNLQIANPSSTQGLLHMGANTLTMGPSATTIGAGDVTGIVKRTSFIANTVYTFGSQFSTLFFGAGGTYPSQIQLKISIGTSPSWKTTAVKRTYDFIQTGGVSCIAGLATHYLDTELNGNAENLLSGWSNGTPGPPPGVYEWGRSNINTSENWIAMANLNVGGFPSSFGQLEVALANPQAASYTWNGSQSTVWTNTGNWTPAGTPSSVSNVVIPNASTTANDPSLPASTEIKGLSIEAAGILNSGATAQLSIAGGSGAWLNSGTFNPNTSTIIFTNAAATMAGATNFYNVTIAAGAALIPESGNIMRIAGTLTNNGILRAGYQTNTIEYNGAGQVVVNPNGNTPGYFNLILSGSGAKTMPGTALAIAGDFSLSGSASVTAANAASVGGSVTMGSGNTLNLGSFSHLIAGNLTNNGGTLNTSTSSITLNGTGQQTITSAAGITVNNLIVANTGANVTLGTSTNCTIGGNLTINAGAIFNLAANSLTAVSGSLSNTGTIKTQNTSASPVPANKTWGGNVEYTGAGAQTVVAGTYNNLTMSGSGGASAIANITVNGILCLAAANPLSTKGILDMGINTLLMGSASTTTGQGDVTGIIRRTTILANTTYSFGNQYSNIYFPNVGTLPSEMSLKVSIGAAPAWKPGAVKRVYDVIQTGGSGTKALLYCHYLDSELNGNTENLLVDWSHVYASSRTFEYGRSSFNTADNWVALSDIDMYLFYASFGGMEITVGGSEILALTWNGSASTDWTYAQNWTPVAAPSDNTAVTIPDAGTTTFDPSLPSSALCKSMTIESGGILNAVDNAQLTIIGAAGAWSNNGGSFDPGNSTIVFSNPGAMMAGYTDFNNVTINAGAVLTLETNAYMGIIGAVTNNGPLKTIEKGATAVDYKGADQTVVVPNPATNSYSTLILSGSGTKTMPITALNIAGDFTMMGSAFSMPGNALNTAGNFTIGNGTSFATGALSHTVGGDFSNDGTFTGTGSSLTFNGTQAQLVSGASATTFNNLTIDNATGVTLTSNALTTIQGTLTINTGKKLQIAPAKQLSVTGTVTNNAGATGFELQSDATGTASLMHNTNNVPATVQRYISGDAEAWHFISSPVAAQGMSGQWLPSGTYGNGTGYDLYLWNEPNNCWIYKLNSTSTINWGTVHPGTNFEVGRGYLYAVQTTNPTKEFVGNLNNGSLNYGLTLSSSDINLKGFNLVGNPYPAAMDWQASSGWTRSDLVSIDGGCNMWIWNPAANNYGVCNSFAGSVGTNSVTRYIAAMQGYFVQAAKAGNLGVNNDVRVHEGAGSWFKNAEINTGLLSVVVKSDEDNNFDEVQLQFGYTANQSGAMKLFSPVLTAPGLFMPSGGEYYSVRYLTDTADNPTVPVMFKPGRDGKYTLSCDFGLNEFESVMLEDRQTQYRQNMKEETTYRFKASKTDDANRFVLHFSPDKPASAIELPARIYMEGNRMVVDLAAVSKETEVFVYDALGRLLLQQTLQGSAEHKLSLHATTQILMVQLKNQQGSMICKLFYANK